MGYKVHISRDMSDLAAIVRAGLHMQVTETSGIYTYGAIALDHTADTDEAKWSCWRATEAGELVWCGGPLDFNHLANNLANLTYNDPTS